MQISGGAVLAVSLLIILSVALFVIRAILRTRAQARQGYVLEPRPSDIQTAIQEIPVMQQSQARKSYIGLGVRWQVTFESAITLSPISVRLMLVDEQKYPWIWCDVHKRQYPQLNGMVPHTPLWVTGQISKITLNDIYLKNVRLEFET